MTYGYNHINAEPIMLRHTSLAADDKMIDIYAADQVIKNGSIQGDTKTHWHFFTNSRFSLWFFNLFFSFSPAFAFFFPLNCAATWSVCWHTCAYNGGQTCNRSDTFDLTLPFCINNPTFPFSLIFFISTWRHCSTLIDLKTTKAL